MTPSLLMTLAALQTPPSPAPSGPDIPSLAVEGIFSVCVPVIEGTLLPAEPSAFGPQPADEAERNRHSFGPDDRQAARYAPGGAYVFISLQPAFASCTTGSFTDGRAVHAAVQGRLAADGWTPVVEAPEDDYEHWWALPRSNLTMRLHYSDTDAASLGLEATVLDRTRGAGGDAFQAFAYRRRSLSEAIVSAAVDLCPLTLADTDPTPEQQTFIEHSTVWNEAYSVHVREGEVYLNTNGEACLLTAAGPGLTEAASALRDAAARAGFPAEITQSPAGLRAVITPRR